VPGVISRKKTTETGISASDQAQRGRPLAGLFPVCAFLVCTLATTTPLQAQSLLRGTVEDDPIQRVGRTASEQTRNSVTPTGTRATGAPPLRQTIRRRIPASSQTTSRGGTTETPDEPAGAQATAGATARPRQQSFRSLEKPLNTTVPQPNGEQLIYQGLPPAAQSRRRAAPSTNPYDPIGLRMGTFTVLPTADILAGYDSNPLSAANGRPKKAAAFIRTEIGINARSDLATHEVTADIRGGYSKYFGITGADRPDGQARLGLRLDYSRDTAFDFELRGRIDTETPGTTNLVGGTSERPITYQTGASVGVTQRFNRLALSARATLDRSTFSDATLASGTTLSQQGRNFNQYGLRLRAAYEITPGFIPFMEALIDTRRRDEALDSAGFRRDSSGVQVRAGTSFELTRILTGEVLAGYGIRKYEDGRLTDLRGPIVEGSLAWAISPLTSLRLRATTEFEETTLANSAGSITKRISAEISHALLRNLVLTGGVNLARVDFRGVARSEDTLRATLGVEYSLSPNLVLRGNYINARTLSSLPGNSISSNIFLFGARLQY
jgi:hypothetical protein